MNDLLFGCMMTDRRAFEDGIKILKLEQSSISDELIDRRV